MNEIVRATPADAGCWIEGSRGVYGMSQLVRIAEVRGMTLTPLDREAVEAWEAGVFEDDSVLDHMHDLVNDTEDWLNQNVAPEGHVFEWHDGEFYLTPEDEEWVN